MRVAGLCAICTAVVSVVVLPASAQRKPSGPALSLDAVNTAEWRPGKLSAPLLLRLQVLLDRAHASPGQIDGRQGEGTRKAIAAFREMRGMRTGEHLDESLWRDLTGSDSEPALIAYTITAKDVAGPFIEHVPDDYREKAALDRLGYTSMQELLAEKFHMSEQLLRRLNPDAAFDREGTEIVVANVKRADLPRRLARIEVDAARRRVLGFDEAGRIVAAYPATVGSRERPSPSGEFMVTAIAEDPPYRYHPSLNLRGVKVEEPLHIPPGPNNPVGAIWIALSAKGYGIHGTPEPEAVGKQASHGCVRLTNWDALELAKHVRKGTPVTFQDATTKRKHAE
jgi:lipoprotein-anchoring transpeptidase ErfK/SrfK